MRIAILSDIHANLEALEAVLGDALKQGCARFYCCGDVVGYGGSPNECCKLLRDNFIPTVKGNHDEVIALDQRMPPTHFNPIAALSVYWSREYTTVSNREWLQQLPLVLVERDVGFTVCHAAPLNAEEWPYLNLPAKVAPQMAYMETPLCFIGHSHQSAVFMMEEDGHVMMLPPCQLRLHPHERYIVNVGSVGQPRDNDARASYFIYDQTDSIIIPRRVAYPIEIAQQKIRRAGLPERLADRLALGR